jgi:hypothetical protein
MLASEIHVSLRVLLQKVNTNKSKNFLPQELDMLFNLTLNNFKNKKVDLLSNPKRVSLFDTQTSLDSLANLFETTELYPISINPKEAVIMLPFDFYGIINTKANISYDCSDCSTTIPNGYININCSIAKLKDIVFINTSTFSLSINYKNKQNATVSASLFNYADLPEDFKTQDNVKDYKKSFIFINAMLKIIKLKLDTINLTSKNKIYVKFDNVLETLVINSTNFLDVILTTNIVGYPVTKEQTFAPKIELKNIAESPISVIDAEYEPLLVILLYLVVLAITLKLLVLERF